MQAQPVLINSLAVMHDGLACVTALAKLKRWSTGCLAASNTLLCVGRRSATGFVWVVVSSAKAHCAVLHASPHAAQR